MSGRFALLIASSQFDDKYFSRLTTPWRDVEELRTVLVDPLRGNFVVELVRDATFADMRVAIDKFFADRRHDDVVLFYYSGHGVRDSDGRLCLAARDTLYKYLWSTSVPGEDLHDRLDHCSSQQQVVLLDCCYSGAMARGAKGDPGTDLGRELFTKGQGRVVLTASDATQYAWEGQDGGDPKSCSIFTECLVEGLRSGNADTNHDGVTTVDEWYDYAYDQVVSRLRREGKGRLQTPLKHGTQRGDIVIARNPNAGRAFVSLEPEVTKLLESHLPRERILAIELLSQHLHAPDLALQRRARLELERMMDSDDSKSVAHAARRTLGLSSSSRAPASGRLSGPTEPPSERTTRERRENGLVLTETALHRTAPSKEATPSEEVVPPRERPSMDPRRVASLAPLSSDREDATRTHVTWQPPAIRLPKWALSVLAAAAAAVLGAVLYSIIPRESAEIQVLQPTLAGSGVHRMRSAIAQLIADVWHGDGSPEWFSLVIGDISPRSSPSAALSGQRRPPMAAPSAISAPQGSVDAPSSGVEEGPKPRRARVTVTTEQRLLKSMQEAERIHAAKAAASATANQPQ